MSGDNMADFYIPPQMRQRSNFILWKLETDEKGKQRKIPYSALYNGKASTTNSRAWTSYENALQGLKSGKYGGLGFVLDKDITFIDLDHCKSNNGVLTPLAENIIDNFKDTFIEVSQSGNGLHIFVLGTVKKAVKTKEIELYSTGRYAALTGNAVNPVDLSEAQQRIDILYNYCNRGKKEKENTRRLPQCDLLLSEREVIEKAENGRNGQVFSDLLNGNWKCLGIGDGTQSSADLKFANMLAFWCGCSEDIMRNIFRSSGMYRNERKMNLAIKKAIADCHTVYRGGGGM